MRTNDPRQTLNPADVPADVPRPADWQAREVERREQELQQVRWHPHADGPPETRIPKRFSAFTVDEGDFQATVSPQKWDTVSLPVPQYQGTDNPKEIFPFLAARSTLEIVNTGANPIVISPTAEKALAGIGRTLAAGATWTFLNTQGGGWAYATGGVSTVEVTWTYWEAPTSHLPPKEKDS